MPVQTVARKQLCSAGTTAEWHITVMSQQCEVTLVPGPVDEPVLGDPRHHAPELFTDLLDRMGSGKGAHRLERRLTGLVLEDPVPGKAPGLDVVQNLFHRRPAFRSDHFRSGDIF